MYKDDTEFIKEYFQILSSSNPEKLEIDAIIDEDEILNIPQDMIDEKNPEKWRIIESNVTEADIVELEESFNIKLPSIYKAFISSYFHLFRELEGVFNDFYYDDDSQVYVHIIPQPSNAPLLGIKKVFDEHRELIDMGYIPIGEFNGWGLLCFDIHDSYKLVWFDQQEYFECRCRALLEELREVIFNNFKEFIVCFFGGVKYKFRG